MNTPLEPFKDILGVDTTPERLEGNLQAYRSILAEIQKLRELDLTDIHPAVIFEPTALWRKEPGKWARRWGNSPWMSWPRKFARGRFLPLRSPRPLWSGLRSMTTS